MIDLSLGDALSPNSIMPCVISSIAESEIRRLSIPP